MTDDEQELFAAIHSMTDAGYADVLVEFATKMDAEVSGDLRSIARAEAAAQRTYLDLLARVARPN